jgi:hypothetical protein
MCARNWTQISAVSESLIAWVNECCERSICRVTEVRAIGVHTFESMQYSRLNLELREV